MTLTQIAPWVGLIGLIGLAGLAGIRNPALKTQPGALIRLLGIAGLAGISGFWRFEHGPGRRSTDELVFALDESCWGRGLALEASQAVLRHVRDGLGWDEASASADDGNLA